MGQDTDRWSALNTDSDSAFGTDHEDLADELTRRCYIGKIFHFSQGRNAWRGSWSKTYPLGSAFHYSLREVKNLIKRRRIQGSQWWTAELPALVIAGDNDALVISEINIDKPFADYADMPLLSASLISIAGQFFPTNRTPSGASLQ